jgi:hypothetical protein
MLRWGRLVKLLNLQGMAGRGLFASAAGFQKAASNIDIHEWHFLAGVIP